MFHQKNRCFYTQIWNLWASHYNRNSSMFIEHSNKIDIFLGKIHHMVCMFRHCNVLLLPKVCRNVQHRDRTWRGNSSFFSRLMFRIQSCILFLGIHSSSRSRTRDTTLIRGLNHGWNRTFVTRQRKVPVRQCSHQGRCQWDSTPIHIREGASETVLKICWDAPQAPHSAQSFKFLCLEESKQNGAVTVVVLVSQNSFETLVIL